jgi:hypothetical protein
LKEILRKFPKSAERLEGQGKSSVGEQLLWLSIDGFDRVSVAGSLDTTQPNFALAWREFHGRENSPLIATLASDDVEALRSHVCATGEAVHNQSLRGVSTRGDVFGDSTRETRDFPVLVVAAQLGAVDCVRFLLANGALVRAAEVVAAFRGGNVEVMRLLWDAFPYAPPIVLALEAARSWNATGLRWLLAHKLDALSFHDLVRLFKGACLSGSHSCACLVLGSSASAALLLRLQCPVGRVGHGFGGGMACLKGGRELSLIAEDSIAAEYSVELEEWLPEAAELRLIARHEGRDLASVNAFIGAAKGRSKTVTFVETENSGSICGGYLDVAWVDGRHPNDPHAGTRDFIFRLRNQFGMPPTKFGRKRGGSAAFTDRNDCFCFGGVEGFIVCPRDHRLNVGQAYEAPCNGVALFCGDGGGVFRAARWELWQAC